MKVYLEGEFPAGLTRLKNATHQLLNEFRSYSSFIEYEFINPSESTRQEERNSLYKQLYEQGLEPINLQVQEKNGSSEQNKQNTDDEEAHENILHESYICESDINKGTDLNAETLNNIINDIKSGNM